MLNFPCDATTAQACAENLCDPGTVLGSGGTAGNKTDGTPGLHELPLWLNAWSTFHMIQALQ